MQPQTDERSAMGEVDEVKLERLRRKSPDELSKLWERRDDYPPETIAAFHTVLGEKRNTESEKSVPRNQTQDSELESLKRSRDWFLVTQTTEGERRVCGRDQFVATLRTGLLEGLFNATTTVDVHAKKHDGTWSKTTTRLAQFAKGQFKLGVLYEPVWSHAKAGLQWGALIGIGLKLLDTLILLVGADPRLAFMFLLAIGVCVIPRVGMVGVIVVSVAMAKFTRANFFVMGLSAALIGATLGCLPGMAVGGLIGLSRRRALPLAKDARPEGEAVLPKAVVFPFLGAAAVWGFYLLVFNPWLVSVIEKQ